MLIYSMSSVGGCPRAVVAECLGYDVVEPKEFMQRAAIEGTRHEDWIAEDLTARGFKVSGRGYCNQCERNGYHVEISRPSYTLIGHIDQIVKDVDGRSYVAEFKALSRFRAPKLTDAIKSNQFLSLFPEYAIQVSCYHHAINLPILYCVKNRDTGELFVSKIEPPITTLAEIDNIIIDLGISTLKETLPKCRFKKGDFERTICKFEYLCSADDDDNNNDSTIDRDTLYEAVEVWRAGKLAEAAAQKDIEASRRVFLEAVKTQKTLVVNSVRITHIPANNEVISYPKAKLEKLFTKEQLEPAKSISKREESVKVEEVR